MQAFVRASGDGAGLRPITDRKPHALVEVNGRPLLGWALDTLRAAGVTDAVVEAPAGAAAIGTWCAECADGVRVEVCEGSVCDGVTDAVVLDAETLVDRTAVLAFLARGTGGVAVDAGRPIGFRRGARDAQPFEFAPARWCRVDGFDALARAEVLFNDRLPALADKRVFFLDRDGTLSLRERKLPGVDAFLARLRELGKSFYVVTNNSSKTPRRHHENFRRMGLDLAPEDVLVSIDPALAHLRERGFRRICWIANDEVGTYVRDAGFVYDEERPEAVLLTYDTELDYRKLELLVHLVRAGVPYFATHTDIVCPTAEGGIPDVGTFLEVVRMTTGKLPQRTFGKPDRNFVADALRRDGADWRDAVVVGDRLYTDIALASGSEMTSVLVLTGETTRADYEFAATRADVVVPDLGSLLPYLGPG